jgi:hypothetical protein
MNKKQIGKRMRASPDQYYNAKKKIINGSSIDTA